MALTASTEYSGIIEWLIHFPAGLFRDHGDSHTLQDVGTLACDKGHRVSNAPGQRKPQISVSVETGTANSPSISWPQPETEHMVPGMGHREATLMV